MDESEDYDEFAHEARRLIDELVNQSLAHIHDSEEVSDRENPIERGRFIEFENEGKTEQYSSIKWPSIAEFTNENLGLEKLHQYIEKVCSKQLISHC